MFKQTFLGVDMLHFESDSNLYWPFTNKPDVFDPIFKPIKPLLLGMKWALNH